MVNKVSVRHQVGTALANSGCQIEATEGSKVFKWKQQTTQICEQANQKIEIKSK